MYADTADYSEWKWGRRATGLVFSAASFAQKLGWAIGGAGAGWLLAYFGYLPNVAQSPRTINGILLMMSVIPAIAAVAAVAALWFYEIDEETVKRMSADLEARRGPEPVEGVMPATPVLPTALPAAALDAHPEVVTGRAAADLPESAPSAHARRAPPSAPRIPVLADGAGAASATPPLTPQELADLAGEFAEVLNSGVHGLCFSPYLEGQSPGSRVDEAQIRARLGIIRPYTRWVRSFSCTDGHERTPRVAHELGMKTLVGAWLGTDRAVNEREIASAIELARAGHVDILAVGNEVLLREDLSEDELLDYLRRVRQAVPSGVPVGYVDAYYLFERHPRVTAACDVLLTNCYPFWEGCPRDQAIAYMQNMYQRTVAVAGGRKVIVSETGWPHTGTAFHGAVPSVEGAMRYFIDTCRWARRDGVEVFYFEAFDEAWKVGAEGDVGAYWGLWDSRGQPKYV
jgi:exo-beta-1,3-glucanase (GH17 family)